MTLDLVWAYFALMALAIGIAALPALSFLDDAAAAGARHAEIDGLRGFLALGVFVFHWVVSRSFIETGRWEPPSDRFTALLGPIGVSLFFMITGFLFWAKMLRAQGRPRWVALYIGRLFRIGPMYLFVVLAMLVIVFARTGLALHDPAPAMAASVLQWLALGMIDAQPDVNGVRATHVLAGVTWTLWYEWIFYASLLATAHLARRRSHLLFVVMALGLCLIAKAWLRAPNAGFAALFLCGMVVASLLHEKMRLRGSDAVLSTLASACLVALCAVAHNGYATTTVIPLALFFYLVCSGASLFGLLTTTPARRLGSVSYSLYLMQGLVLTLVLALPALRRLALASQPGAWAVGALCLCALVLCAAIGYACIERPAIAWGKRLMQRADARHATRDAAFATQPTAPARRRRLT